MEAAAGGGTSRDEPRAVGTEARGFRVVVIVDADAGQRLQTGAVGALLTASLADPEAAVLVGWSGIYHPLQSRAVLERGVQAVGVGPGLEMLPMAEPLSGGVGIVALAPFAPRWAELGTVVQDWSSAEGTKCWLPSASADPDAWDGCGLSALIAKAIALQYETPAQSTGVRGEFGVAGERPTSIIRMIPKQLGWRRCTRVPLDRINRDVAWKGAGMTDAAVGSASQLGSAGGADANGAPPPSDAFPGDRIAEIAEIYGDESISWMSPHSNRFPWRDEPSPEMRARCKLRIASAAASAHIAGGGHVTALHYAASLYEAMEGAKEDWESDCD